MIIFYYRDILLTFKISTTWRVTPFTRVYSYLALLGILVLRTLSIGARARAAGKSNAKGFQASLNSHAQFKSFNICWVVVWSCLPSSSGLASVDVESVVWGGPSGGYSSVSWSSGSSIRGSSWVGTSFAESICDDIVHMRAKAWDVDTRCKRINMVHNVWCKTQVTTFRFILYLGDL